MSTTDTNPRPMTIDEAAESLLLPEGDTDQNDDDRDDQQEIDEQETDELSEGDDEQELSADDEADDEEDFDDGEDEDDDQDEDEDEEPSLFTVKVDGEEKQVPLDELLRGYSGQAYIQKQMQTIASKRKSVEELGGVMQQQALRMHEILQSAEQNALAKPVAPDPKIYDSDPIRYMEEKIKFDADFQAYEQQRQQLAQATQQHQAAQQAALREYAKEQREVLQTLIPAFADEKRAPDLQKRIRAVATDTYGFAEDELKNIVDHRYVRVLHDAMQFQALQKKGKATVAEKVTSQKANKKPLRSKARKQGSSKVRMQQKQRQRLRQTGSIQDAIDLIME